MRLKTHLHSGQRAYPEDEHARQIALDRCRGIYLCEMCEEAMTDTVLSAAESPTGADLAICPHCQGQGWRV